MANNLSCNIQHYNTDLPGRALLSEKQRPDLAHQESENSIPRSIDCVHSSRVLCISLRCARLGTDRLRTRSRYAGLASQENPEYNASLSESQIALAGPTPYRFLSPGSVLLHVH